MTNTIGITGGLGYIGMALAEKALLKGYNVKIIDNKLKNDQEINKDITVIRGSVLNEKDISNFLEGVDFIYHLSALSNVRECSKNIKKGLEINTLSTRLLLEGVKDIDISGFLFSSSIVALYGNPIYLPLDENHPIKPVNDYGVMKRSSELFCQSYYRSFGVPTVILRQSTIYGPSPFMKYDSAIHNFIRKSIRNEPINVFGDGNQKRNFLWIEDLIDTYLEIYDIMRNERSLSGEIFNISGPDEFTIREVVRKIQNLTKKKIGKNISVEFQQESNEVKARDLKISNEKIDCILKNKKRTKMKDGLEKLFDYILEEENGKY